MTQETFDTIRQWADDTFGPITTQRAFSRASEEWDELLDELYDEWGEIDPIDVNADDVASEAADVIICLCRLPGVTEAIQRKMAVNRCRKWRLMGDGTGYHIKDAG